MTEHVIEVRPRPRRRIFIKLSGGRSFILPEDEACGLNVGDAVTGEEAARLSRIDQYFRGKEKALRLLSIRARARQEIRTSLDDLGIEASIRNGIVQELEEVGLIDDERFARDYTRAKIESKQLGPYRLKYQLAKFGVKAAVIDAVLEAAFSADMQEKLAWEIVNRKLPGRRAGEKEIRRLSALLKRKGFDFEIVNRVSYALLRRSGIESDVET
jgi:regulatory protein